MSKLILCVRAKCSDCCTMWLQDGVEESAVHEGYVPSGLGVGSGKYIDLEIDAATGQILNWAPVTAESFRVATENSK